jgi:ATP-binding cassette subfamily B protein
MTEDLQALSWSPTELGRALEALARKAALAPRSVQIPVAPRTIVEDRRSLNEWIGAAAQWFGFEAEAVTGSYDTVDQMLRGAGPALLELRSDGTPKFLALLNGNQRTASLLGPDLKIVQVPLTFLRTALVRALEAPLEEEVLRLIKDVGISDRRRADARSAILRERLRTAPIGGCWLLRTPPGASFWRHLRQAHLPRRLLALVAANAVEYFLWILSWWLVGRGALEGRFDRGWLLAWALLLLTIVPFRLLGSWLQGVVSIQAAGLLKRRLLYGALRLVPEEVRHQGAGQFLGQVIESEAVESMALSGGFLGLTAAIELAAAAFVLGWGAGATLLRLLLLGWIFLTLMLSYRYFFTRQIWTQRRLNMTHDLIERMVGHRTRMAQEGSERWHDGEDEALERYLETSKSMDGSSAMLMALVPRGWLVLGLIGLTPAFISSRSPVALAIALGGILLAYRALESLTEGLSNLADATISWKQVAALFNAAARPQAVGLPAFAVPLDGGKPATDGRKLVEAHDLGFRYQDRGEPVLHQCNLSVACGDRLLLEGESGGGKSTLASLLVGMRTPQSGLLLLEGLDRQTLGVDGWRRRVVSAPQFHENHVLTETFAFNLLMGRRWPPSESDIREAEEICHELGLGELLQRMPAGLLQMVGETGWQLSHGERSRLYVARTLLQDARLIILDESFAALDPETLRRALNCVLKRASTLMAIAHP